MARATFEWVPEHDTTLGDLAAKVGEDLGMPPDEDQRRILDAIFAYKLKPEPMPACFSTAVLAPRQNIKTSTLEIAALTDLFVLRDPLHVWTAHLFDTAQKTFLHMLQLIDGNPEYSRLCARPRKANGDEAIVLRTGEEIQFHARSKGAGRGFTGGKLTYDEALFLQPADIGNSLPILATIPWAQVRYGSSACLASSAVLRGLRDRGRAGGDPDLAFFEWCAEVRPCADANCAHRVDTEGCALDDPDLWAQANPALDRRISRSRLRQFRREMPPDEFMREFLGWHEDPIEGDSGIPAEKWAACIHPEVELANPVTLALDVAPNQASAAIAACGGALEVLDHRPGTSWVVAELKRLKERHGAKVVGLDPTGPAGALEQDLVNAGFVVRSSREADDGDLYLLTGAESVQACGALYADIIEGNARVRDQPILNEAVGGAARRKSGDAWKWSRIDSTTDITPLVAVTVARFLRGKPSKKQLKPVVVVT